MRPFTALMACCALWACDGPKEAASTENKTEEDGIEQLLISFPNQGNGDSFEYFVLPDTQYLSYQLPSDFVKPEKWQEAEKTKEGYGAYGNEYPDSFGLEQALSSIDTASSLWHVASAKSWCLDHYEEAFPHLIARLTHKKKIGLTGTADLIIHCRLSTGDLKFYGHGGVIMEDIFTVAGRASWILNELTGEEFAVVSCHHSKEELQDFKQQWIEYVSNLKV